MMSIYYSSKIIEWIITSRIYKDPPLVLGKENYMYKYKIRKITPLEAWRLMCFKDEDYLATKVGSREKATELIDKYNIYNLLCFSYFLHSCLQYRTQSFHHFFRF